MKTDQVIALALGGLALWIMLSARKASAAPLAAFAPAPLLMHPADVFAGTWTSNGPLVPSAYDKQIWD